MAAQARDREIHERFARGIGAEQHGDWTAAATEFQRIIVLDPPEPKGSTARYDLALAEARLDGTTLPRRCSRRPSIAIRVLRRPPRTSLRSNSGAATSAAARAAADRFIAIAPDAALAHYSRGIAALRAGDLGTARTDFRSLSETDPTYAVAHTIWPWSSCARGATKSRKPNSSAR